MQLAFGDAERLGQRKKTRRELFLNEMDQVVPWKRLLALIEPHYPIAGRCGRQPYPLSTMLHIHFLQQWYALSDPSMEEALYDTAVMRRFAGINSLERIPDETTILNFRRLLETHGLGARMLAAVNAHLQQKGLSLRAGTIVDATIIHAPSSTKNADKARELLHGKEDCVLGDSGYTGAESRPDLEDSKAAFLIARKRGKVKAIKNARDRRQHERWESCKASMRAKVEHPYLQWNL